MANVKVTELDLSPILTPDDIVYVVDGGDSKKSTVGAIASVHDFDTQAALIADDTTSFVGGEFRHIKEVSANSGDGFSVIFRVTNVSAQVTANPSKWIVPTDRAAGGSTGAYEIVLSQKKLIQTSNQTLSGGQTAITVPTYTTGLVNKEYEYFLNGLRFSTTEYTETNSTTITLDDPAAPGEFTSKRIN